MKIFGWIICFYGMFCMAQDIENIQKRLDSIVSIAAFEDLSLDKILQIHEHPFLTSHLIRAIQKTEQKLVKMNCQGNYQEGMICGLDYNPISCSQDIPLYVYEIQKLTKNKIIIKAGDQSMYYLIQKNKNWQLDGIACIIDKDPTLWMHRFNVKIK